MKTEEKQYLASVETQHRREYAQFFTPPAIVRFMRNWILAGKGISSLFDPAAGLGAFFEDAPPRIAMQGVEVDEIIYKFFLEHIPNSQKCHIVNDNYLLRFGEKHDGIICNPPYLKFQKFDKRGIVQDYFKKTYGITLSGYTNIASAFLLKSIFELTDTGRLAYIMPSEFLNAGYGTIVKECLVKDGHLRAIIEIGCEQEAFPDATTSLCIILYDASTTYEGVSFFSVGGLDELDDILEQEPISFKERSSLNVEEKWGSFFNADSCLVKMKKEYLVPLSTYGHFSRGIATGANEFFVLRKSEIDKLRLGLTECSGCVTKSAQITKPVFSTEDFEELAKIDAPVFLFNVCSSPSVQALSYIAYGSQQGYDKRYITRNRTPWYKMESRSAAPIMLNVFSRDGYKVIRNYSSVNSLTPFHCFYPKPSCQHRIDSLFLFLFSDVGHKILACSSRKYGNQLDKYEPNDLNKAFVPSEAFLDNIPVETVKALMSRLRHGEDIRVSLNQIFETLVA